MKNPKLCVDCKWCSDPKDWNPRCVRPKNDLNVDLVTGKKALSTVACWRHRAVVWPDTWFFNYCGKRGRWFEAMGQGNATSPK